MPLRGQQVSAGVGRTKTVTSFVERRGSFDELQSWVRTKAGPSSGFVFRGQKAVYPLSTTLERACTEPDSTLSAAARDLEERCVREFRRRIHHYVRDVPRPSHRFEILALMQHHGAPTRLLDWTYCLEVATYFALVQAFDDLQADMAVWIVNDTWCKEAAINALAGSRTTDDLRLLDQAIDHRDEPRLARILVGEPIVAFVFPLSPFRLNERLTLQKGLFLCPGDVTRTFEENLRALDGHDREEHVLKFVLPRACLQDTARRLFDLNITDATLFPGLDGFARSLRMTLRFLERRRKLSDS